MMKPIQNEVVHGLATLLDLAPTMRVGQLVAFLGDLAEDMGYRRLGDIDDEDLLTVIERHRGELAQVSEEARNA
jgi:hypothetical protein